MNSILKPIHEELGIGEIHLSNCKLSPCEQPSLNELEITDLDFDGKPFILTKTTAHAWREMCAAADSEKIVLKPFSGFRSYIHQKQLIKRRLEKGHPLEAILREIAIPGFSEHHSGRAIDICAENRFVLDEAFETTPAFAWLSKNAQRFKFRLSYPRGNNQNIIYEPWHWYFQG
jgi:D-alanyl-D-alanine carboxypeptidase